MKITDGRIRLAEYHFERLLSSLHTLQFQCPAWMTAAHLQDQVLALVHKNGHQKLARVRLTIYRGNGGLYDPENHFPHYLIQSWELNAATNLFNENGLVMGVFTTARKVCDGYSHIKSNNFLSYAMAALWAKQQQLNDALLLNPYNGIADTTIANLFIVKDGLVKTPPLTEGAVAGTMRRYLLRCLREENLPVEETPLTVEDALQASEIFLTNAIQGIRWVKQLEQSHYHNSLSAQLHRQFIVPL
ncbi:class IV aminotransferase [Russula earlei]|uniref:Class IV aminotransferase n=1 Tax=Russula earlei TaxID=71964 RepID=A0ACC0TUD1_9AGAM|nr:class IV aminotransferase [Russula earlei]